MIGFIVLPARLHAAHLEKVDEQIDETSTPAESQGGGAPTCEAIATQEVFVEVGPNEATIEIDSSAFVRGRDESCNATASNTADVSVTFAVVPDPGDSPGQSLSLCFRAAHDLRASDTGGVAAASASLAGFPTTDPSVIVVSSAGTVYTNGPIMVADGQDRKSFGGSFTAKIGDTIEMRLSTASNAKTEGIGTAEATTHAELIIDLGTCRSPVPAASHTGLLALALALATLGGFTVARRSRPRRATIAG
jgi:hypothetical protein